MTSPPDPTFERIQRFLRGHVFAVVGASNDRSKYGNRVLRHYLAHGKEAIPVHPTESVVEGVRCASSLRTLGRPVDGVSVIVPPHVSLLILEDAVAAGIRMLWLQPGAEDDRVLERADELELEVIAGGPCVLVSLR
jgi:uncharacterized protein